MYTTKLPHQQLSAWLMAAVLPGAIQLSANGPWLGVLLASVACLLCVWLCWQWGAEPRGKWVSLLQWILLVAVLSALSQQAPMAWPQGNRKAVALILLALALWSAWKGVSTCARVGSVLFWFILVLYLVLLGTGVKEVQPGWLLPKKGEVDPMVCVLFLTPAAAHIHLNKKETCKPRLLLTVAFSTLASGITAGVLSPGIAAVKENAFYEMSRSLNLLGQARRIEAVLSAGMTAGWFSLLGLYLTLCGRWTEKLRPGWGRKGMASAALLAVVSILLDWKIQGFVLLMGAAFLWVLVPLFAFGNSKEKKSK